MLRDAVRRAADLLGEGDAERARAILSDALDAQGPAGDDDEATTVAEATGMLVRLEASSERREAIELRLMRMSVLTGAFDGDAVREARAVAELGSIEWIRDHDHDDAVALVDVLRAAESLVARYAGDPQPLGVRRARAEAAHTAESLRQHLGQDLGRVAAGFEVLALTLTTETDPRLRHLRIAALCRAARIRYDIGDDRPAALALLGRVVAEAESLPSARGFLYTASLALVDDEIARGIPAAEAISHGVRAVNLPVVEPGFAVVTEQARHLDAVLARLPDDERDRVATVYVNALVDRHAACESDEARDAILWWVLRRTPDDAAAGTAVDRTLLAHTDSAFAADHSPVTAPARVRVATRLAELTARLGDPEEAVRLYERADQRFATDPADERLAVPLALADVDRALRLADIGRRDDGLTVLGRMPERWAPVIGVAGVPAAVAQARYWRGRFLRESGRLGESARAVTETVDQLAGDPDPDLRVWAANSLFSQWQSPDLDRSAIDGALGRFADLFTNDPDLRIRRLDARRRLAQATRAAERGETGVAATTLQALVRVHGASDDADVRDVVASATENQAILALSAPVGGAPTAPSLRYRELRARSADADRAVAEGRHADAEALLRRIVADTGADSDVNVATIGLAALDVLGGLLLDAGRWEELVVVARSAALRRPGLDTRAERVGARARLRLGIALARLGDLRAAVEAYEALDRFAAGSSDGDVADAVDVAVYNRAVLIDDLGDPVAAIAAYDRVLAVHARSVDSAARRLRRVKALRNKALLLTGLGRTPEAARAHRMILDIAGAHRDPEIAERARRSAFDLADCHTQLGDHRAAAELYHWMRSAGHLGFTRDERRKIARAAKESARAAGRSRR